MRLTKNLIHLARHLMPMGEGFPLIFEIWILHLRASPACRMTFEEKIHKSFLNSVLVNEALKRMDDSIPQDLVHFTMFFQKCSQLIKFPFPGLVEGFRSFKVFSRNPI